MKKIWILIYTGFFLATAPLFSQEVSKTGTTAAGFLCIDVGARAVAMGGAFTAIAEDVSTMYWNPAGIARIDGGEALFTYNNWIADITFNYVGMVVPLGTAGKLGVNATFVSMDDVERTTIDFPDGTGEYVGASNTAVGLCYARNLTDKFSVGMNFKWVQEKIYHCSANGIAFDIGTLFTTEFFGTKIGMNIANYGSKMTMSGRDLLVQVDTDPTVSGNNANINGSLNTESWDMPLLFRVGFATDVLKGIGNSNLIVAADACHPNDDTEFVNVGCEYMYAKMVALRVGYNSMFARDTEQGLTLGAGLMYKMGNTGLKLDYAYKEFGILKDVQMFSVSLLF